MKLHLLTVSQRQPEWIEAGCAEYIKRMPGELPVVLREIKPEARSGGKTREQLLAAERTRVLAAVPEGAHLVVLDERGDDLTTEQLARRLDAWQLRGQATALVIGGADGTDPLLKKDAREMIRLSSLTLPHGLANLLLCEQLYRAASVLKGHPYHRA